MEKVKSKEEHIYRVKEKGNIMKIWNIPPQMMCNIHLLDEYNALHAVIESKRGQINAALIKTRHDELAQAIKDRYNHHLTPIKPKELTFLEGLTRRGNIDIESNITELRRKCKYCALEQQIIIDVYGGIKL